MQLYTKRSTFFNKISWILIYVLDLCSGVYKHASFKIPTGLQGYAAPLYMQKIYRTPSFFSILHLFSEA